MMRYFRLFGLQVRMSLQLALQYRWDFLLEGLLALVGAALSLIPLWVAFEGREKIAGWSFPESLLVLGWFTLLKGVLEGAVNPSLVSVVEHIRTGSLDFVLLKPADAQFLVSTARFVPWRLIDAGAALAIFLYAFNALGGPPDVGPLALALLLLVCAVLVLYSLWILVISAAFHVVRIDNLAYLFLSIFDAARWPSTVFRGVWRVIFTVIIPLGLMTTYPAQALLGTLEVLPALLAVGGAVLFAVFARFVWLRSLAHYTSASS